MTKKCLKCNRDLPVTNFNWKIKDIKRSTYCKECSRNYIRMHYKRNRQYYLDKAKKRNSEIKKRAHRYISQYLKSHPCVDCGETDILVLEFDHKNRNKKKEAISRIIRGKLPFQKLVEEVSKCEVRCANCHRRKTQKESKSWKLNYAPVA